MDQVADLEQYWIVLDICISGLVWVGFRVDQTTASTTITRANKRLKKTSIRIEHDQLSLITWSIP